MGTIDILQSHWSRVADKIRNSAGGDCEATAMWSMGVAPKGKQKNDFGLKSFFFVNIELIAEPLVTRCG